jgi:hypothetical protein
MFRMLTVIDSPHYDGAFSLHEAAIWAGLSPPQIHPFRMGTIQATCIQTRKTRTKVRSSDRTSFKPMSLMSMVAPLVFIAGERDD